MEVPRASFWLCAQVLLLVGKGAQWDAGDRIWVDHFQSKQQSHCAVPRCLAGFGVGRLFLDSATVQDRGDQYFKPPCGSTDCFNRDKMNEETCLEICVLRGGKRQEKQKERGGEEGGKEGWREYRERTQRERASVCRGPCL